MEIKLTLQYSNPHVIRQLVIPEKFTLEQLYRAFCACVDRDTLGKNIQFLKNGMELQKTQQVSAELVSSDTQIICICGDQTNSWEWRIEPVLKENQISKEVVVQYPKLLRYQGPYIGKKIKNVMEFNRDLNRWYGFENHEVMQQLVNLKLSLTFVEDEVNELDNAIKVATLESCLSEVSDMKVDQMRQIEKKLNMKHPTNVSKKRRAELIVQDYMENPEVMKAVLESMQMTEYEAFLKLYDAGGKRKIKNLDYGNYRTLIDYGLVLVSMEDYGMSMMICMSIELVVGAKHFVREPQRSAFRRITIAKAVIEACVSLYGFANYWHYNRLIDSCYKKFFTPEQKKDCWESVVETTQKKNQEDYVWSETLHTFCRTFADQMWVIEQFDKKRDTIPYYMPDADTIQYIQTYGADYPMLQYGDLFDAVSENCVMYEDPEDLTMQMLKQCIDGESPNKIAESHKQSFYKKVIGVKRVKDALVALDARIRRPKYYGHTKIEYMNLTGGKIQ